METVPDYGLYKITQYLFDHIHNKLPEVLHNLPIEVTLEGFLGGYLLTKFLQFSSKSVFTRIIPNFDSKTLPKLERLCEFGIPGTFLVYSCINPNGARDLVYNKPMDNLGIFMAYLGGIAATEQGLNKRKKTF